MLEYIDTHPWLFAVIVLAMLVAVLKIIDLVFSHIHKRVGKNPVVYLSFLRGVVKALVSIVALIAVGRRFPFVNQFYSSILMSSSLIVVVLGFILQEGLTNIVHGFILSIFKPFAIGDRIRLSVDGMDITGHVEAISLRNTVIRNVLNSNRVIVPNAKIDLGIIENSRASATTESTSFIDLCITYDSDLDLACRIISEEVVNHPLYTHRVEGKAPCEICPVYTRELSPTGVALRATVYTKTIEENFAACSDIRMAIARRVQATNRVNFAANRVNMVKDRDPALDEAQN